MTTTTAAGDRHSVCSTCGAAIVFARLACASCATNGSSTTCSRCKGRGHVVIPLDATAPTYYEVATGTWQRSLAKVSHVSTCPDATQHSRKAQKQPGEAEP